MYKRLVLSHLSYKLTKIWQLCNMKSKYINLPSIFSYVLTPLLCYTSQTPDLIIDLLALELRFQQQQRVSSSSF